MDQNIERVSLWELYKTFFKVGAMTFGGGYAMLPILEREVMEQKKWVTKEEIMDYYAIGQGLPGMIAVNVGVLIGHRYRGFSGGAAAAFGVVSPCLIIIMVIAAFLSNFQDNIYVQHCLRGISVCVCALILSSIVGMWKKGVRDLPTLLIFLAAAMLSVFTKLSPVLCVLAGAVLGLLLKCGRAGGDK